MVSLDGVAAIGEVIDGGSLAGTGPSSASSRQCAFSAVSGLAWLAMAGVERFIVEIFRAKDDRFFGALTLAQVISIGLVLAGIAGMMHLGRRGPAEAKAR